MSPSKPGIVFLALALVLVVVMVMTALMLAPVYQRNREMAARLEVLENELSKRNAEFIRLAETVEAMRGDPREIERLARERFNMAREGEIIYLYPKKENSD